VEVEGWFSREDAIEEIETSRERFKASGSRPADAQRDHADGADRAGPLR